MKNGGRAQKAAAIAALNCAFGIQVHLGKGRQFSTHCHRQQLLFLHYHVLSAEAKRNVSPASSTPKGSAAIAEPLTKAEPYTTAESKTDPGVSLLICGVFQTLAEAFC
eukprot:TRINITY_DN24621_c0_g1_i2.p1 TRINITY_DN24621_c0_g1~~TRINITY_DN24621_c0_g1_i2.p1  ORF type:complete len:108 (-),score=19.65 TRINITY_DN24621_c0_g1_i2:625-948(-)